MQSVSGGLASFRGAYSSRLSFQTDEIKASMENGVLTVTFPKAAPQEGPKRITVT